MDSFQNQIKLIVSLHQLDKTVSPEHRGTRSEMHLHPPYSSKPTHHTAISFSLHLYELSKSQATSCTISLSIKEFHSFLIINKSNGELGSKLLFHFFNLFDKFILSPSKESRLEQGVSF